MEYKEKYYSHEFPGMAWEGKVGEEAKRVVNHAIGGQEPTAWCKPVCIHEPEGSLEDEEKLVLRGRWVELISGRTASRYEEILFFGRGSAKVVIRI